jgi:transcriptional regulator GlxA family with amidase domain
MDKTRYAFLTLSNYSLIAVTNALEVLRMANRVAGRDIYEWSLASLDGRPAAASSGLELSPTVALDKVGKVEILFVCGGINVREAVSNALLAALRRLGERRVGLGALCTGGYALARAGLLDNYRATIHWENLPALREEFPRVQLNNQVFSIDRDRYTASGGTAPLDLMLNLVQLKHGLRISQQVSEQFVLERVRSDRDRQYVPLRAQVGSSHGNMIRIAQLMEENIEKPLSVEALAREALLPGDAAAPGAGAAAADGHADHGCHDVLRLQVTPSFLPLLPGPVRLSPERGTKGTHPFIFAEGEDRSLTAPECEGVRPLHGLVASRQVPVAKRSTL